MQGSLNSQKEENPHLIGKVKHGGLNREIVTQIVFCALRRLSASISRTNRTEVTHHTSAVPCPFLGTFSRRPAHFCAVFLSGREPSSSVSLGPGPSPESAQGEVRALHSQVLRLLPQVTLPLLLCRATFSSGESSGAAPSAFPSIYSSFHLPVLSRGSRPKGHCLALLEEPAQQVTAGSADKGPIPGPTVVSLPGEQPSSLPWGRGPGKGCLSLAG